MPKAPIPEAAAGQVAVADPLDPNTWTLSTRDLPAPAKRGRKVEPSPYVQIITDAHAKGLTVEIPFAMPDELSAKLSRKLATEARTQGLRLRWVKDDVRNTATEGKRPEGLSYWMWRVETKPAKPETAAS